MLFVNLNFELGRHWLTYTLKPSIAKSEEWQNSQSAMEFKNKQQSAFKTEFLQSIQ